MASPLFRSRLTSLLAASLILGAAPLLAADAPIAPPQVAAPVVPAPIIKTVMGHTFTFAPLPVPNGYDVLRQAAALLVEPSEEQAVALARKDIGAQRAFVAVNQETLGVLQQGLQVTSRVPLPDAALATDIESYGKLRGMARLMAAASAVQTADGDLEGASNTALDIIWFSQAASRGGASMPMMVGNATEGLGRAQLWALLPRLNAEQLHFALNRLRFLESYRAPFADVLRVEQFYSLQGLQNNLPTQDEIEHAKAARAPDEPDLDRDAALKYAQHLADQFYDFWEDEMKASRQPYHPAPPPIAPNAPPLPGTIPTNADIAAMMGPSVVGSRASYERNRAQSTLLIAGLALRAYQLDKGTLPDTLDQLTPTYLPKPLTDPLGLEAPLHYKRDGETFTLYSVGPDGQDDGGQPFDAATQKGDLLAPLHTFTP